MAEKGRLFLKLVNKTTNLSIAGDAEDEKFARQIVLDDWRWDYKRKSAAGRKSKTGGPRTLEAGEVEPSVLSFSKRTDRATMAMLKAMDTGTVLKATITLQELVEGSVAFSLTATLDEVRILKFDIEGDVDDASGELKEKWTFNYGPLQIAYQAPGKQGGVPFDVTRSPDASTDVTAKGDEAKFEEAARALGQAAAEKKFKTIDWNIEPPKGPRQKPIGGEGPGG